MCSQRSERDVCSASLTRAPAWLLSSACSQLLFARQPRALHGAAGHPEECALLQEDRDQAGKASRGEDRQQGQAGGAAASDRRCASRSVSSRTLAVAKSAHRCSAAASRCVARPLRRASLSLEHLSPLSRLLSHPPCLSLPPSACRAARGGHAGEAEAGGEQGQSQLQLRARRIAAAGGLCCGCALNRTVGRC